MASPSIAGSELDALDAQPSALPADQIGAAAAAAPPWESTKRSGPALRESRRRDAINRRLLAVADVLALALALAVGVVLVAGATPSPLILLAFPAVIVVGKLLGLYDRDQYLLHRTSVHELPKLLQVAVLIAFCGSVAYGPVIDGTFDAPAMAVFVVTLLAAMVALRACARRLAMRLSPAERCVVIGDQSVADDLAEKVESNAGATVEFVGRFSDSNGNGNGSGSDPLAGIGEFLATHGIHRGILAPGAHHGADMLALVGEIKSLGVKISILPSPSPAGAMAYELDRIDGITLLGMRGPGFSRTTNLLRRTMDLAIYGAALVFLRPLMAVALFVFKPGTRRGATADVRVIESDGAGHSAAESVQTAGVGLVHDYLLVNRGAESTFAAIADCWPDADIYTTLYSPSGTGGRFDDRRVHTSELQRLGIGQDGFRTMLPLFPGAVERLPLADHELVVSSSSAFAHGVKAAPDALHVCYCHTPFRYAWYERDTALAEVPAAVRPLLSRELARIRRWDLQAAENVTHYIANSRRVQERIARIYGRESVVIHPPVDVDRFSVGEPGDSFLIVTELVSHKRVDVALEAARRAGCKVKVVGTGPELGRLRENFPNAEFLGRVSDAELTELYSEARAFLVPNVEEFGIAAVEAQAAGRPVLAVAAGGVLETVREGETGILLPRGDADEFAEAMREVDFDGFDGERIARHAEGFSTAKFQERLIAELDWLLRGH